jgi:broad specificity phosphatase PhoE
MLELFVVRHGESVRNLACRLAHQGQTEILEQQLKNSSDEPEWPLTEKGMFQATLAGKWLHDFAGPIDASYCSPYLRTRQTAQYLQLGVESTPDLRLREREWGTYPEGGYKVCDYLVDLASCNQFDWKSRFEGSESIHDLLPSTEAFLRDLREDHPSGRVVIVTHGGRMGAIERLIEGEIRPRRYANCCVLQYRIEVDSIMVRLDSPAQFELESIPWQTVGPTTAVERATIVV